MKGFVLVSWLLFLVGSQLAYSRLIRDGDLMADGVVELTVTCEATYGFLPCSTNVWGLLFMIVVYEILLSMASQLVSNGSNLFFQIIGPGVLGGSVFQILGTIPQLVVILESNHTSAQVVLSQNQLAMRGVTLDIYIVVSSLMFFQCGTFNSNSNKIDETTWFVNEVPLLTGSVEEAQQRAATGLALVLGGVVMLLTLGWGLSIILGSYEEEDDSKSQETTPSPKGPAVVTDVETSLTARLILVASLPLIILLFLKVFTTQSGKRVIILIALILTILLLAAYIVYQSFQPWIQNRVFEYMMDNQTKDKLLKLISSNGRPDARKIQQLFNKIQKDNNASVTAAEIRVLIVGVKVDDEDRSTNLVLENITSYFDTSGDGGINRDEFIKGMTRLASRFLGQTPAQTTKTANNNSQVTTTSDEQQALLSGSTTTSQTASDSWSIILRASFFVIFGTAIACVLAEPLISSVIEFADAANMSSFCVSYVVLPLALNYEVILQSISSATQKAKNSNSLALSSLYGSVFMGNMIGLMPFLAPIYFRNLSTDVSAELVVVLLISIIMGLFTSFYTTFPRWTGYVVLSLYPISLVIVYILTSVLGW